MSKETSRVAEVSSGASFRVVWGGGGGKGQAPTMCPDLVCPETPWVGTPPTGPSRNLSPLRHSGSPSIARVLGDDAKRQRGGKEEMKGEVPGLDSLFFCF